MMVENMEITSQQKLKKLLRDLFQFDISDVDFGIYRVMNHKRSEIEKFIEKDLVDAAGEAFKKYAEVSTEALDKEIASLKKKSMSLSRGPSMRAEKLKNTRIRQKSRFI